ncbi:MAG: SWIM zinc finger family protein, partial [Archangium sp.]
MSRSDLLSLSADALASLANVGLVKRATKEVERGEGPAIAESDGTVTGTFTDGVVTTIPPNATLKQATCTCGAAGVCRHRLATVLAYQKQPSAKQEAPAEPWHPGDITDTMLEATLDAPTLAAARRELSFGLVATVTPGVQPSVSLPSCTVRFLVKLDAGWARCDCKQQQGCLHVALAVWVARGGASGLVQLGGVGKRIDVSALERLTLDIVTTGLTALAPAAARFAVLREAARKDGHVWLETLLEDLEQALDGWRKNSARFTTATVRKLLLEMWARCRATKGTALPVAWVVGDDAARETMLDHVRLLSLGCRLDRDGTTTFVDVFTVDPDTQEVLVLRRQLDDVTDAGNELDRRTIAPKVQLGM